MSRRRTENISLTLAEPTLGELRAALAEVVELSDATEVRVRTAIDFDVRGARVRQLTLTSPTDVSTPDVSNQKKG